MAAVVEQKRTKPYSLRVIQDYREIENDIVAIIEDDDDDDELLALAKERRSRSDREFITVDEYIRHLEQ